ncbi:MAG: isoprenylcysteine carboxylmethyltransferase family protein [Bacteroidota bacterium]|jgi:protein-S-isoprenylcysteine O-methyltransferase Ste14
MDVETVRFAAFLLGSLLLVFISRKTLLSFASHGFYRFFAWECILALLFINLPFWFCNPLSPAQIGSWILLFLSLFALVLAVRQLHNARKPDSERLDDTLYKFERTTQLVTSGIYHYIRHPMYASLLYLSAGAFLKNISPQSILLFVVSGVFLTATAKADEKECLQYFGPAYTDYKKRTTMFIPYIF